MQFDSSLTLALFTLGGTLLGVIISGFFNLSVTRLTKRSEERRHHRELVIQTAVANWKQQMEAYAIHQQPIVHIPLEVYLIQMAKFSEFMEGSVDPSTVEEKYREYRALSQAAIRAASPKKKKN